MNISWPQCIVLNINWSPVARVLFNKADDFAIDLMAASNPSSFLVRPLWWPRAAIRIFCVFSSFSFYFIFHFTYLVYFICFISFHSFYFILFCFQKQFIIEVK